MDDISFRIHRFFWVLSVLSAVPFVCVDEKTCVGLMGNAMRKISRLTTWTAVISRFSIPIMAGRRAGRKNAKDDGLQGALSKEDENIAKYVRFNCPTKSTMFESNEVHYFTGKNAVDTLMESKKYGENAKDPKFARRSDAAGFLSGLLQRGLFFRARVLVPKKKEDPRRNAKQRDIPSDSPRVRRLKNEKSDKETETAGESGAEQKPKTEGEEKKKKKIKLVAHDNQVFNDDSDVYVWIFDPTPLYKKLIGLGIVLGTILACLFPLWPDWLRLGVYYLSVTGIALFGLLLGVALARTILFGIIYAVTFGKHKLWILPNLTEDCGFFESFQPFYTYEYCTPDAADSKSKKKEKKSKQKDEEDTEPLVAANDEREERPSTPAKSSNRRKPKKVVESEEVQTDERKETPDEVGDDGTDPEEKYSNPSSADDDYEIVEKR
ncbi:Translocation protein 1 [Aphelenchoides besseyi]|nr:Translocation protein 1 [Aphelenchoides besseyi]KAI6193497.1 Translocation protein 1 [Aphelenchoides besseyi]